MITTLNLDGTVTEEENAVLLSFIDHINDPQYGGLTGLVDQLSASGLSTQVYSWISTEPNMPITSTEIQAALLSSPYALPMFSNININDSVDFPNLLAVYLPQVVDQLTPQGQIIPSVYTRNACYIDWMQS